MFYYLDDVPCQKTSLPLECIERQWSRLGEDIDTGSIESVPDPQFQNSLGCEERSDFSGSIDQRNHNIKWIIRYY